MLKAEELQKQNEELKATINQMLHKQIRNEIKYALVSTGDGDLAMLLTPHIENFIKVEGTTYEIINPKTGDGRINNQGKDMSIPELITELKNDASSIYAAAFKAKNQKVETQKQKANENQAIEDGKISVDDIRRISKYSLDDVAAGKILFKSDFEETPVDKNVKIIPKSELDKSRDPNKLDDIAAGRAVVDFDN